LRIVFDTNLLISALFFGGKPLELLNLIKQGRVDVIVTTEILFEYKRSMFSFSQDEALATEWRTYFREFGIVVETTQKFTLCRDADDNKFLNAAHAAKANFIISGDKDLREVTGFHIPVVTVAAFLAELKKKGV
jgi:putative PIN family toxin of toxin-antitoxin system